MSTEGIDESLHGFGGIEEIPSKIGVFSRTQQLRFGGTRDSEGYNTMLDGFESLQRVTKTSRNNSSSCAQESTKENRNSFKQSTIWMNSNRRQTPRGHKEDWASFPTQSQYKNLNNPYLKSLERRGRKKRGGRGHQGGGERGCGFSAGAGREREERGI